MKVSQVNELVNAAGQEVVGTSAVLNEDFSNVVDFGRQVLSADDGLDNYVRAIANRVGKTVFLSDVYNGKYGSIMMDAWEFGSVLLKVSGEISEAVENPTWDLHDGQSVDPNIIRLPAVTAKLFNSKVTFEIDKTFPTKQVKESFNGQDEMVAFVSMLETWISNSMTLKIETLSRGLVNSMIAETVLADYGDDENLGSTSHVKAVNLLYLYNQIHSDAPETTDGCIRNPDFIRFAAYTMGTYIDRLASISTLFNIDGKERFTPGNRLRVILLSDFAKAADVYLYGDTFHEQLVKLPEATDTIPFWQGSGTTYGYSDVSKIHVTTETDEAEIPGILGVMMDRNAMAVCNTDRRTYVDFLPKAEVYQHYYKYDASYFAAKDENFVVFFAYADAA